MDCSASARSRRSGPLAVALRAVVVLILALPGALTTQMSTATEPSATTASPATLPASRASVAISIHEVAPRAAEVAGMLRGLTETLTPTPDVESIRRRLPALREQIDGEIVEAARILHDQPTLGVLQAQQQLWQQRHIEATGWLDILTRRASVLQDEVNHLTQLRQTWTVTREVSHASQAPQPILRQIDEVLASIEATRVPLEA